MSVLKCKNLEKKLLKRKGILFSLQLYWPANTKLFLFKVSAFLQRKASFAARSRKALISSSFALFFPQKSEVIQVTHENCNKADKFCLFPLPVDKL